MNNKKLKIISVAIGLLAYNNFSQAQWAVIDSANLTVNNIIAKNTFMTAQAVAANGQKITQTNEQLNVMTQQSVNNELDADTRRRVATGEAKMAEIANKMVPTLAACIEASKGAPGSPKGGASKGSAKSLGDSPQGEPSRTKTVVSTATAQANVLKQKESLGTCSPELAGAAGCDEKKTYDYAKGDYQPRGIKGNIEKLPNDGKGPMLNNYTYAPTKDKSGNLTGVEVAKKYAADMAYHDAPKVPTKEQLAKNPAYAASYVSVQTKLDAAHDSITDIIRKRLPGEGNIASTVPGKLWAVVTDAEYTNVTGLKEKPKNNPSMFEMLNYEIRNDYFGNKDAKLDSMEEVNKRLALNNFIAWNQYQQQENTNILLSHILVQLTTPVNKAQVDNEFQKTMSSK